MRVLTRGSRSFVRVTRDQTIPCADCGVDFNAILRSWQKVVNIKGDLLRSKVGGRTFGSIRVLNDDEVVVITATGFAPDNNERCDRLTLDYHNAWRQRSCMNR